MVYKTCCFHIFVSLLILLSLHAWFVFIILFIKYFLSIILTLGDSVMVPFAVHPVIISVASWLLYMLFLLAVMPFSSFKCVFPYYLFQEVSHNSLNTGLGAFLLCSLPQHLFYITFVCLLYSLLNYEPLESKDSFINYVLINNIIIIQLTHERCRAQGHRLPACTVENLHYNF